MDQLPFQIPTDLRGLFTFLMTGTLLALFMSEFLEKQQRFQRLSPDAKNRVVLYFSIFFSVLGFALQRWTPDDVVMRLNPLWAVIVGGVYIYLAATKYHEKAHEVSDVSSAARAATAAINAAKPPEQPSLSGAPVGSAVG